MVRLYSTSEYVLILYITITFNGPYFYINLVIRITKRVFVQNFNPTKLREGVLQVFSHSY